LPSIWSPGFTVTSAITPSASAWMAVSSFIAAIDSSTSPALSLSHTLTYRASDNPAKIWRYGA
jgi:hypothetical protein